jgi:hypothetical protein
MKSLGTWLSWVVLCSVSLGVGLVWFSSECDACGRRRCCPRVSMDCGGGWACPTIQERLPRLGESQFEERRDGQQPEYCVVYRREKGSGTWTIDSFQGSPCEAEKRVRDLAGQVDGATYYCYGQKGK